LSPEGCLPGFFGRTTFHQRSSLQAKAPASGSQDASAISMMIESMVHMVQGARSGSATSFDERI
jgi:hypothetical protein